MNDPKMTGVGAEETGMLTRRQALKTAAGLVLLLPMAAVLADDAPATPDKWTAVGKAEEFVKGQPKRVALADGTTLYVTRQGADMLVAVSAKCTHRGCEVGWQTGDAQFHCPCHGAVFASSGANVRGTRRSPDKILPPLPTAPARQKDGQVQVNLAAAPADDLKPDNEH